MLFTDARSTFRWIFWSSHEATHMYIYIYIYIYIAFGIAVNQGKQPGIVPSFRVVSKSAHTHKRVYLLVILNNDI